MKRFMLIANTDSVINVAVEDAKERGYQILWLDKETHDAITWYGVIIQKDLDIDFGTKIMYCIKTGNTSFRYRPIFSN